MPISYFRGAPKIDLTFRGESFVPGDTLDVTVKLHAERPGIKVRRGVVELVMENRYTHSYVGQSINPRSYGALGSGGVSAPVVSSPFSSSRVTEERVDRDVQGREEILLDAVLRHRTEIFQARFTIKPPPVRRTMERRATYMVVVHLDIPRMRDVEAHRTVPVKVT